MNVNVEDEDAWTDSRLDINKDSDGQKDRRTSRHAPEYKDRTSARERELDRERERKKLLYFE